MADYKPSSKTLALSNLSDDLARKFSFIDFWSAPEDIITITDGAADLTFPDVVVAGLPTGLTAERVVLILTARAIFDTSGADNYINAAAKTLRIKVSTGAWGADDIVAITFAQNSLYTVASSKESGPVIIGVANLSAVVNANGTYNVRSDQTNRADAIVALGANLVLYDVQTGIRVYYS